MYGYYISCHASSGLVHRDQRRLFTNHNWCMKLRDHSGADPSPSSWKTSTAGYGDAVAPLGLAGPAGCSRGVQPTCGANAKHSPARTLRRCHFPYLCQTTDMNVEVYGVSSGTVGRRCPRHDVCGEHVTAGDIVRVQFHGGVCARQWGCCPAPLGRLSS
jgi:hypothetical protein